MVEFRLWSSSEAQVHMLIEEVTSLPIDSEDWGVSLTLLPGAPRGGVYQAGYQGLLSAIRINAPGQCNCAMDYGGMKYPVQSDTELSRNSNCAMGFPHDPPLTHILPLEPILAFFKVGKKSPLLCDFFFFSDFVFYFVFLIWCF